MDGAGAVVVLGVFILIIVAVIAYRVGYLRAQVVSHRLEAQWRRLPMEAPLPPWRRAAGWVAERVSGLFLCLFLALAYVNAYRWGWTYLTAAWIVWFRASSWECSGSPSGVGSPAERPRAVGVRRRRTGMIAAIYAQRFRDRRPMTRARCSLRAKPSVTCILLAQPALGQKVPRSTKPSSNFTALKLTGLPQAGHAKVIVRAYLSRFRTVSTLSGAAVSHTSARCRPSSCPARREH